MKLAHTHFNTLHSNKVKVTMAVKAKLEIMSDVDEIGNVRETARNYFKYGLCVEHEKSDNRGNKKEL